MFYVPFKKEQCDAFSYPKSNGPFESLHKLTKYLLPTKLGGRLPLQSSGALFTVSPGTVSH